MADINDRTKPTIGAHITCLSWRSILAGLAVSLLSFMILMILGVAFGGIALSDMEGFTALSWTAAIWTVLAGMIALFAGAYATSRISNYFSPQVGVVQAVTISALFFGFTFWTGGAFLGSAGGALANAAGTLINPMKNSAQLIQQISQNPEVLEFARSQLSDLGIEPGELDEIAVGVVSNLITGGVSAAENYIAQQTNIDPAQTETRIAQIRDQVLSQAESVASNAAQAFSAAAWFLFIMLTLSTAFAILGGVIGSRQNAKGSLEEGEWLSTHRAA